MNEFGYLDRLPARAVDIEQDQRDRTKQPKVKKVKPKKCCAHTKKQHTVSSDTIWCKKCECVKVNTEWKGGENRWQD